MKTRVSPLSRLSAFTLIELLTVIAIIAILMGLLFPAIGAVKEGARKAQAKNDVTQIVTSVKAYNTEYGKYPTLTEEDQSGSNTQTTEAAVGDPAANMQVKNNALFNTLRAIPEGINQNHKYNPRRVVFFDGKAVSNPLQPRAGFVDKGAEDQKGVYFDPWGKEYNVILDSDYDNKVLLKKYYSDIADNEAPRVGVAAFALGKDNKLGKEGDQKLKDSDDVVSWQ